jgi:hypothetical protein
MEVKQMIQSVVVKNEKPQVKAGTKTQGQVVTGNSDGNNTTLAPSKARYERGLEL